MTDLDWTPDEDVEDWEQYQAELAQDDRQTAPEHDDDDIKAPRKSASTVLFELAQEHFHFGVSDAGDTFAVPKSGPKVVRMLRGGKTSLRSGLAREYFARTGRAAPQQALADALLVIEGFAQDKKESKLEMRVAEHDGDLWLDLGDSTGRAVRITSTGWTVEPSSPILFRRSSLNSPLPEPRRGGSLDELWTWLNITKEDHPLILAWLVLAIRPDLPHPILDLSGEQGSGKTTAQKVLVSIIDPSPVPTRKPPRDAESWVTAASGSWIVGLDNLSMIPDWLSDCLCRAVTGEGDVRRKLYMDSDLIVFAFRRCIILTGIDLGAVNGDLTDRLLPVHLDLIDPDKRREEGELWPGWQKAHPRLLGALLDAVVSVRAVLPSVRLESKPRMADFGRVLAAVDKVFGTHGLERYVDGQSSLASESLTGDPFIMAMQRDLTGTFKGTSAELLSLVKVPERPPKYWPTDARRVTQRLHRQAPIMRRAGWKVTGDKGHTICWTIIPLSSKEGPYLTVSTERTESTTSEGATSDSEKRAFQSATVDR